MDSLPKPSGLMDLKTMAIGRLMLDNFPHIKAYWVMLGIKTAQVALAFGADDLDGTVVHEKIYHEAGAETPQEVTVGEIRRPHPRSRPHPGRARHPLPPGRAHGRHLVGRRAGADRHGQRRHDRLIPTEDRSGRHLSAAPIFRTGRVDAYSSKVDRTTCASDEADRLTTLTCGLLPISWSSDNGNQGVWVFTGRCFDCRRCPAGVGMGPYQWLNWPSRSWIRSTDRSRMSHAHRRPSPASAAGIPIATSMVGGARTISSSSTTSARPAIGCSIVGPARGRFSEFKGTPFFNSRLPHDTVLAVLENLAEGCSIAIRPEVPR